MTFVYLRFTSPECATGGMGTKADCIFCKIVRKEAPAHVVCGRRTLVFMDIFRCRRTR
jgi:hypothetical protein